MRLTVNGTGADGNRPGEAMGLGGDRPRGAMAGLAACQISKPGAAQAGTGRQHGQGFKHTGFAGAVSPGENHGTLVGHDDGAIEAAKVGQRQARDGNGGTGFLVESDAG